MEPVGQGDGGAGEALVVELSLVQRWADEVEVYGAVVLDERGDSVQKGLGVVCVDAHDGLPVDHGCLVDGHAGAALVECRTLGGGGGVVGTGLSGLGLLGLGGLDGLVQQPLDLDGADDLVVHVDVYGEVQLRREVHPVGVIADCLRDGADRKEGAV